MCVLFWNEEKPYISVKQQDEHHNAEDNVSSDGTTPTDDRQS